VILVAGASGELGGAIVRHLLDAGEQVRCLVRADAELPGAELARGDLRDAESLRRACEGVDCVISTVTAMARALAGEKVSMDAVDRVGTLALLEAAEAAGVERFVALSYAGVDAGVGHPLERAKLAVEERLKRSSLRGVAVRPDAFQETHLTETARVDLERGRMAVFGRGESPIRYVAVDDVAALVAAVAREGEPPAVLEFGGPEALTKGEVGTLYSEATGRPMKVQHMPRPLVRLAARALSRPRPALASVFGLGLMMDTTSPRWDDAPLRERGITPRPASEFIAARGARSRGTG
jgi:uncharacterized protein YbjT (DUF2867 family)